jgi:hypothetical protein
MSLEDYTTKPAAPADGSSGETDVAIMDAPPNYDVRRVDEQKLAKLIAWADPFKQINIAEELPEDVLQRIGMDCNEGDDIDETSRHDWLIQTEKALDLAMQKAQAKTEPWPGSSNVIYPASQAANHAAALAAIVTMDAPLMIAFEVGQKYVTRSSSNDSSQIGSW